MTIDILIFHQAKCDEHHKFLNIQVGVFYSHTAIFAFVYQAFDQSIKK